MLRGRGGEREHEGGRIKRGWMEGGGIVRGDVGSEGRGEEGKESLIEKGSGNKKVWGTEGREMG